MASKLSPLFCVLAAAALSGCAALFNADRPSPEAMAERGLAAQERGDYAAAFDDLVWVYTNHPERRVGRYALLALAAAEMDPANPSGRLDSGTELASGFLAMQNNPTWTVPVAGSLHRLAVELGETRRRALLAERELEATERRLEAAEMAADLAAERAEGAEALARSERQLRESLQARLGRVEEELAETRRELARVRRALGN